MWFDEGLYPDIRQGFAYDALLHESRSAFQSIQVFDTPRLGRVLVLDGVVQTTERDEFVYHEMMAHVPLFGHGAARRVLIVGGGDGGILREVLRHPVDSATMVEIDGEVVRISREFLPALSAGAFEDPRARLIVGDGAAFLAGDGEAFDAIVVDSTDPIGPGEALFRQAFYADCRRRLAPGGVLVTQNGTPFLQPEEFAVTAAARARLFRHSGFYFAAVPTYYGGAMAFGWASDGRDLAAAEPARLDAALAGSAIACRHYNAAVHAAAFAMPNWLRERLPAGH